MLLGYAAFRKRRASLGPAVQVVRLIVIGHLARLLWTDCGGKESGSPWSLSSGALRLPNTTVPLREFCSTSLHRPLLISASSSLLSSARLLSRSGSRFYPSLCCVGRPRATGFWPPLSKLVRTTEAQDAHSMSRMKSPGEEPRLISCTFSSVCYSNIRTHSLSTSGTSIPCGQASMHCPHSVHSEALAVFPSVVSMP